MDPEKAWDWEHQHAETALTIKELSEAGQIMPGEVITLDLEFVPDDGADRAAFEKALESFGYDVEEAEGDPTVSASIGEVPFTLEAIWTHEERTTKLALSRGFRPDGWGFWGPED